MGASGERSTDEADIRALLERWAKSVRARDYPAILAGHAGKLATGAIADAGATTGVTGAIGAAARLTPAPTPVIR